MKKENFGKALEKLRKDSKQRKFKQGIDFIINLKGLNLKRPEEQVELFVPLKFKPKKAKICCIVGAELIEQARANAEMTITLNDFPKYSEKAKIKQLARKYDWFVAQATIMTNIAKAFGRVLGPRGKMPNPKAGCVVPPNANLKVLCEKLRTTIKVSAKVQPSIKVSVGNEGMADSEILENIRAVYSAVLQKLPHEEENIKSVLLKLSMSKPVNVADVSEETGKKEEKKPEKEKPASKKPEKTKKSAAKPEKKVPSNEASA